MDVIAAINLAFAVLYLLCARGCQAYALTCKNLSNRNKFSLLDDQEDDCIIERASQIRHSAIFKSSIRNSEKANQLQRASQIIVSRNSQKDKSVSFVDENKGGND